MIDVFGSGGEDVLGRWWEIELVAVRLGFWPVCIFNVGAGFWIVWSTRIKATGC